MTADASLLFDRRPSVIARRPALPIAILLVGGIALFGCFLPIPSTWIAVAVALLIAAAVCRARAIIASSSIAAATFLLGVTLAQCAQQRFSVNDIGNFASDDPVIAQVRCKISHDPVLVYPATAGGRNASPKQVIVARALAVHGSADWIAVDGQLLLTLAHPNPWLRAGQTVEGIGMLGRAVAGSNPGQIDWQEVYRRRGILATIEINRADNVEVVRDDGIGAIGWLQQESRHLLSAGFTVRRMTDYALLRELTLGDSDPDSRDVQEAFAQVGLAYQLSISGMHIAVLVATAYLMCRCCRCSPRGSIAICIAVVLLYGAIALPTTAARRAVFICVAFLVAPLRLRQGDKLQLLSLAAIGLAVIDPMEVLTAGFQLGFVTVLGLSLFAPRMLHLEEPQSTNQNRSRSNLIWRRLVLGVRAWLILSVVAWVVSLPLVAFHFEQINPWAVLLGIFVFPLVAVSLLGGWAKMISTLLWPSVAGLAARAVEVPVFGMRMLALKLAHLPGASVTTTIPPIGIVLLYYALLLATLIPIGRRWLVLLIRGLAGVGIAGFLMLICGVFSVSSNAHNELSVTLLNIGAGQCAVLRIPGEQGVTLIDCGSDSIADVSRSVIVPVLQAMHERSIARVFLSHSDYDHISGLQSLTSMLAGPVYTSNYFARFAERDYPAKLLLEKLQSLRRPPLLLHAGDHIALGPAASIDVLWPTDDLSFSVNDTGLVLRLNYAGRTILFPADIQTNAMRQLQSLGSSLHCDFLVAPHHGSSETTTDAFIKQVAPLSIVASNGAVLTGKQRLFDQLIGNRIPLFRTSVFGAVTIHITQESSIETTTFHSRPQSSAQ